MTGASNSVARARGAGGRAGPEGVRRRAASWLLALTLLGLLTPDAVAAPPRPWLADGPDAVYAAGTGDAPAGTAGGAAEADLLARPCAPPDLLSALAPGRRDAARPHGDGARAVTPPSVGRTPQPGLRLRARTDARCAPAPSRVARWCRAHAASTALP